jgi:tetratricopeptide (TPR) repeat protein
METAVLKKLRRLDYQKEGESMSEDSLLQEFKEDFALFIEAGFIAVKQLDEIAARRLFKTAELINPDNPASQLGLGYIALNKLQVSEAGKIFEAILKKDPNYHLAKALLGICYLLTKGKAKKGEELIQEAKEKSDDPTIKNLADICIQWAEKDLRSKSHSPLVSARAEEGE